MQSPTVERQARTLVYDLMNEAKEHGFGAEDKWTLIVVNDQERARIKKDYYPVLTNKPAARRPATGIPVGKNRAEAIPEQGRIANGYDDFAELST